jgi:hypothetical protein
LGIEKLFLFGIELLFLGVPANQFLESLLIDIVIHLASDHALKQVESFNVPSFLSMLLLQKFLHDFEGFPLLLNKGQNEPDDVGDHIAVLELLRFL